MMSLLLLPCCLVTGTQFSMTRPFLSLNLQLPFNLWMCVVISTNCMVFSPCMLIPIYFWTFLRLLKEFMTSCSVSFHVTLLIKSIYCTHYLIGPTYRLYRSSEHTNQRILFDIEPRGQYLGTGGQVASQLSFILYMAMNFWW